MLVFLKVLVLGHLLLGQTEGSMRFNTSTSDMEFYNGTSWVSMDSGSTGVACAQTGSYRFNSVDSRFEFCDGSFWKSMMGGGAGGSCSNTGSMGYNSTSKVFEGCNGSSTIELKPSVCGASPSIGDVCTGGGVYAGSWNGNEYMVTPGGCTDSATPTCAGGSDTTTKTWATNFGYDPGAEEVAAESTQSTVDGDVNTAAIVAYGGGGDPYPAAEFCNNMDFGGFSDWYLPAKTEISYIMCKSNRSGSLGSGTPADIADCTAAGGKSTALTGFVGGGYWSSSSGPNALWGSWTLNTFDGAYYDDTQTNSGYVRCIRKL